jgi:hypothetical protein
MYITIGETREHWGGGRGHANENLLHNPPADKQITKQKGGRMCSTDEHNEKIFRNERGIVQKKTPQDQPSRLPAGNNLLLPIRSVVS